jgi:oligopeptide transport system permease protein
MQMFKYILQRLIYAFLTVLLLLVFTYCMMQLLPGDPFIGEKPLTETAKAALMAKYGLDKPLIQQIGLYILRAFQGDLGTSLSSDRAITKIIGETFPISADLGLRALVFALVFGIALGVLGAIKRNTGWDSVVMVIATIGVSIPSFVIASFLQYFVSLQLNKALGFVIFPTIGWNTEISKVLPAFSLGLGSLASITRLTRTSMIDVLNSDYIKTAKAKGLNNRQIIFKHGLRNALLPVVTVLGPMVAGLLTGAFVIEKVFAIPGMGKYFVTSVTTQDYTVIAGTTIFYGAFLVLANLAVDIAYGFIDPRIRLAGRKE